METHKQLCQGLGIRNFTMETTRSDKYDNPLKYEIRHLEGTILKCIKCGDSSTPFEGCKNCGQTTGLSIYYEGADSVLRCFSCELNHTQTRWVCKKCGAKNPIGKTAFHWTEVTGPIKEGCFIATVCYGSYEASEVVVLRKYRDTVLLKRNFGKVLVSIYYKISPFFARLISRSKILKKVFRRFILSPIIKRVKSIIY